MFSRPDVVLLPFILLRLPAVGRILGDVLPNKKSINQSISHSPSEPGVITIILKLDKYTVTKTIEISSQYWLILVLERTYNVWVRTCVRGRVRVRARVYCV